MSESIKKIISGSSIVFVSMIFSALFNYLFRLILSKNLSLSNFGLFFSVFSFITMVYGFKTLGFGSATVNFLSKFKGKENEKEISKIISTYLIIQVVLFILISFFLFLFSKQLETNYFKSPNTQIFLFLFILAYSANILTSISYATYQAFQNMFALSMIDFLHLFLIVISTFFLFKLNLRYLSPLISYVISFFLVAILNYYILVKKYKFKLTIKFDKKHFKKMFKFGYPLILSSLAVSIFNSVDTLSLTYFDTLENVAMYNIALSISNILKKIPKSLSVILFPVSAALFYKNKDLFLGSLKKILKFSFVIILPSSLVVFSFSKELITLLYGTNFLLASETLQILAIGLIFSAMSLVNVSVLLGMKKSKGYAITFTIGAIMNIILNIILTPKYGIRGTAFSLSISNLFMFIISYYFMQKKEKLPSPLHTWIKTIIAGIIFVYSIILLKNVIVLNMFLESIIILLLSGIVYLTTLFLFKIITYKEIRAIFNR